MENILKKRSVLILSFIFGFAFASLLIIGVYAEQNKVDTARIIVSADQPDYVIPDGKASQWESIQKNAEKELAVCREHCGNIINCIEKCKTAFNSRLEREYQKLIH